MKLLGAIVGGFAFAGVAVAGPGAASAQAQTDHVVLALPVASVTMLAAFVALDAHLWEKQGVDVKDVLVPGIGAMNAVISNSAEFSISSAPSITRAYAHGQKLVALAATLNQSGMSVVVRKDVADAAHFDPSAPLAERAKVLKGRTIAIQGVGAINDMVLRVVAKAGGMAPNDLVESPMQPPEYTAALARHAVDGFSGEMPFIQQVVLDGSAVIVSDSAKGEPTEFSPISPTLLVTRPDYCPAHRSICEKMGRGIADAARMIRTQRTEILAIMKARFGAYDDKVLGAAYDMAKAITPESVAPTIKELDNGDRMNIAAGFLKPEDALADYSILIDSNFVK